MPSSISPKALRRIWREGGEVALFDLREESIFAEAHPFFAASLPLSDLEIRIGHLVPRRETRIVLYDGNDGLAERAAAILEDLGFANVALLEGGLAAYAHEGELFRDVNAPSKAFGELVEAIGKTPSLSAPEVHALLESGADVVVLDCRRFDEYQTMSLPKAVSVPGAELALKAWDIARRPATHIIVNCAGRTRSIIGTQSLINAGLPHRITALRNGTIGWTLEGLALETGQARSGAAPSAVGLTKARKGAAAWAEQTGVRAASRDDIARWADDRTRTLYRFDVRALEDYLAGHPEGFLSAPGGQLVQATDEWAPVRGARIVLFDDDGVRARMTASWLVQMGWEAFVAPSDLRLDESSAPAAADLPPSSAMGTITAADLAAAPAEAFHLIDLAPSRIYRQGHVPGARFALRSRFAKDLAALADDRPLVLISPDGLRARFAAAEAARATGRRILLLEGGTASWTAGLSRSAADDDWLSPPIDLYKRPYEGTDNAEEAMRGYLEWEYGLIAQIANDGIANFRVIRPEAPSAPGD